MPGRQTAEYAQTRTPTWFLRQLAHAERRPEVLPDGERESFRHDSDHGRLRRSEPHDTTYHRRIRAESHLPEAVPQNDDCGRLRRLVLIHEHAPHQRGNAGHPKSSGTNLGGIDGSPTCSPTIRFRWTNRNAPMSSRVRSPSRQLRTSYELGGRAPDSARFQ